MNRKCHVIVIIYPIVGEDTVAWFRIIPKKTRRRKIVRVRLVPLQRTRENRRHGPRLRGGARVTKGSPLPTAVEYERVRTSPEQRGPLCVTFSWKFRLKWPNVLPATTTQSAVVSVIYTPFDIQYSWRIVIECCNLQQRPCKFGFRRLVSYKRYVQPVTWISWILSIKVSTRGF